jgi:hypothetical protein
MSIFTRIYVVRRCHAPRLAADFLSSEREKAAVNEHLKYCYR